MEVKIDKLTKAKVGLLINNPFFASIALNVDYIEDSTKKTATTNGKSIFYNPEFIEKITDHQTRFLLAHEVMHISQKHHLRQKHREIKKWNKACDYAINPILKDCGFELIEGALINPAFDGMSAEQIYNLLPDEDNDEGKDDGQNGNGESKDNDVGGCGGVEPYPSESEAEEDTAEQQVDEQLAQAINHAKKQGKLPAWLERVIKLGAESKADWKEILANFLSDVNKNDYTFRKPNTRYLNTGFYLPSLYNEEVGDIVMFVDTSGSVDEELINKFGVEMQEVVNTFNKGFHVVYIDTEVHSPQFIEPDEAVNLKAEGGGGTDFKPGFEWIEKEGLKPKAVVYFTDGYCNSFPQAPDYPVLWALYMAQGWFNNNFNPPFGEVIKIIE